MKEFQHKYERPLPKTCKKAQPPKPARSEEDEGILDMFGVLPGTEEDDTP